MKKLRNIFDAYRRLAKKVGKKSAISLIRQKYFGLAPETLSFHFLGDEIHVNNDDAAFYHIEHSMRKMKDLVKSVEGDCKVAFDIGANNGWFSYFLKKRFPEAQLYIFEPFPDLVPIIHANLNGFDNYEIIEAAVSDKDDSEVSFYINPASLQTNSLIESSVAPGRKNKQIQKISVPTITLDRFIKEKGIKCVDVMKVDVQGAEYRVLEGGKQTLSITKNALFEACMFDIETNSQNIVAMLQVLVDQFSKRKIVNSINYGADILFYNESLRHEKDE